MDQIDYIVRESGEQAIEQVPGGGLMRFLYGGNPLGKLALWMLIKRKLFSQIGGWYMSSKRSAKRVAPFVKDYNVPIEIYYSPGVGYKSFNQFFYRKIKPEYRPIEEGVVSSADGKILVFPEIKDSHQFFVKGQPFDINTFLNDVTLAEQYLDGAMAIIRLAPVDYHRYHFPISGQVSENTKIRGAYYSVSPLALRKRLEIFCENKREFAIVNSKDNGKVLICDVGATLTGSIIQTYQSNTNIEKGDEKGYFAFGGSTLILLFEKGKVTFNDDLISNTKAGFETTIKMGEQIGV